MLVGKGRMKGRVVEEGKQTRKRRGGRIAERRRRRAMGKRKVVERRRGNRSGVGGEGEDGK